VCFSTADALQPGFETSFYLIVEIKKQRGLQICLCCDSSGRKMTEFAV
jgi:hypothetical protein